MPYKNDFSGVYCLKTLNTKLIYIGSSKGLSKRKALHKSAIKKGDKKRSSKIIDAVSQGDIYSFEIIELCENLLEREQYWINFYKSQNVYELVNEFDADRNGSDCSQSFKNKMSKIREEKWKDDEYREQMLPKLVKTQFTAERLNKQVHIFGLEGEYLGNFLSAKNAASWLNLNEVSVSAAARGMYRGKFKYKDKLFIYQQVRVLYKLDELLEAHQELRVISSQAWEVCESTMKVQRLTIEQHMQ